MSRDNIDLVDMQKAIRHHGWQRIEIDVRATGGDMAHEVTMRAIGRNGYVVAMAKFQGSFNAALQALETAANGGQAR